METDEQLEHEAAIDAATAEAFEAICPNVLGNPYIPHFPLPAQAVFLGMHQQERYRDQDEAFQCLYGGAAGGGKSDALLMGAAQYAWKHPEFAGVCLRRTYQELSQPDALMDRAKQWWIPAGVHFDGSTKLFSFPDGGRVKMGYHAHDNDNHQYQGAAYQYAAFDELTHWPDATAWEWIVLSRLRRAMNSNIPIRGLAASNPGGPGHVWVRNRFVGGFDESTGLPITPRYPYVPARVTDNPYLDQQVYIASLERLHPTTRQQLLDGDWGARDPGDYFRREWYGPMLDPVVDAVPDRDKITVRWWDLAASENETAARTAGHKLSRTRRGLYLSEHHIAFRATPGKRDAKILQTAQMDGHHVLVGLEIEGGSGGPAQVEYLTKTLTAHGFKVVSARPRANRTLTELEQRLLMKTPTSDAGKAARAAPVASCLERGHQRRGECSDTGQPEWGQDIGKSVIEQSRGLRIYRGPWAQAYLDMVEGFPDASLKDDVDATSGAFAYLEAHPFGSAVPPRFDERRQPVELANVHPEDRPRQRGSTAPALPTPERWRN